LSYKCKVKIGCQRRKKIIHYRESGFRPPDEHNASVPIY
jgi:hypothetical protein